MSDLAESKEGAEIPEQFPIFYADPDADVEGEGGQKEDKSKEEKSSRTDNSKSKPKQSPSKKAENLLSFGPPKIEGMVPPPMMAMPPPGAYGMMMPMFPPPDQINKIPNPFQMIPGSHPYGAGANTAKPKGQRPSSANPKQTVKKSNSQPTFMAPIIPVGPKQGSGAQGFPNLANQQELMSGALWQPDLQFNMDPSKMTPE